MKALILTTKAEAEALAADWGAFGSTPKVICVTYDGADVAKHQVFLNDTLISSAPIGDANATSESAALGLGLSIAWGRHITAKVAACGWRNGVLSDGEITSLTNYLRGVYGV